MPRYTAVECLELAMERFDPEDMTEDDFDEFLDTAVEAANLALEAAGIDLVEILEEDEEDDEPFEEPNATPTRKSNPLFRLNR